MSKDPPTRSGTYAATTTTRLGFWAALLTAFFALSALAIGIMTPPRSGPFCVSDCLTYPYTDGAPFVPRDYLWMYPATLMALGFMVLMICIHHHASEERKIYSHIGFSFALVSAAALSIDYFIQLAVMQPSFLKGETEGLSLFSQYNPHGIFIALEDLGYLMMSAAFLFAGIIFSGRERLPRAIRWVFVAAFIMALLSLVALSLYYGYDLEYRFECAAILINWVALIVTGVLLAVFFKAGATVET
jgi:hypothetical protein